MKDRLQKIFSESLCIPLESVVDDLKYSECPDWDSVAHMGLVAAIEESFDIMIDAEDVIDMSSFLEAQHILAKYLG